jgi:hypothetical protein
MRWLHHKPSAPYPHPAPQPYVSGVVGAPIREHYVKYDLIESAANEIVLRHKVSYRDTDKACLLRAVLGKRRSVLIIEQVEVPAGIWRENQTLGLRFYY